MTKNLKFFLIALILSFPFWWGTNIGQENLEEFLFQREITSNQEILAAQASQIILEKKLVENLQIEARAAISVLIRPGETPKILFEKNKDKKLPVASLVKLMTAHLVLKNYNLSEEVKISSPAVLQPEEFGKLKVGQTLSVKDLLYPLLIESSNDAAFALAEVIGQKKFVDLMNLEAERLGLENTYFANSTGLDPWGQNNAISYSTTEDLVKLTKYLLKEKPLIWEILSTAKINIYGQELINTNKLLNKIPGIIGGKTGETPRAGGCLLLVLPAPENQGYLINIILGSSTSENRFEEMKKLIGWLNLAYNWDLAGFDKLKKLNWQEITDSIPWSKRDAHASLVFQDKIWIFGGVEGTENFDGNYGKLPHKSDIWVSENGRDWQLITEKAPWGERGSPGMTIFKNKIWLFGGWEKQTMDHRNDVWVSEDGLNWKRILSFAPWQARSGHSVVVFNNKLWLIGGVNFYTRETYNDVWYSEDGINWIEAASNALWPARYDQTITVFRDKMWLMGGVDLNKQIKNDIWVSENGRDWRLVISNALWPKRHGHTSVVFKDRIWIISGWNTQQDKGLRDVWYSENGYNWEKTLKDAPWTGREDHTSVVFQDKIWLMGGMDTNWTWKNDVWRSVF